MSPTEGYKIKLNSNDTLAITGTPVNYVYSIPLKSGWNIMGYPQNAVFDGMDVVHHLIDRGTLVKVLTNEAKLKRGTAFLKWNGKNTTNQNIPSGIYFLKILVNGEIHFRKVIYNRID